LEENRRRDKSQPEFELLDTGVFDDDHYFDVFVEYAKADVEDILIKITVTNHGPEAANLRVLPTILVPQYVVLGKPCPTAEAAQSALRSKSRH
jgi:hypothetical protein